VSNARIAIYSSHYPLISVTPHVSWFTQLLNHLPMLSVLAVVAFCIYSLRRKASRFAMGTPLQLPLSAPTHPPTFDLRPRSPPPPPPRPGKGRYHRFPTDVEDEQSGGASSSNMQNPPEYSLSVPESSEAGDNLQPSGRRYHAPLQYGLAPGVSVDDDLVDRIAHRVAGLVHASQSPPQYEAPA
jgi:hypothetical protein